MNPKVDFFFEKASKWQEETRQLRKIALDCGLTETLKWGNPCYTFQDGNVVLIHCFKDYCALLFFKGALISDTHKILIQQTENVQAARQLRFTKLADIRSQASVIKAYIFEAIEIERSGLTVPLKKTAEFKVADEFQQKLNKMPKLKTAFEALTPGRQRAYMLHFASPKQSKTRESRIEKAIPRILDGKGLED